jgi:hypothetical protein
VSFGGGPLSLDWGLGGERDSKKQTSDHR